MARTDNLTNYLTDVSSAIKSKLGDNTPILASDFDIKISEISGGGGGEDKPYDGSVDRVGLKAIGWEDDDIDYFQTCVNWYKEDNANFEVPQVEIDMYNNNATTDDYIAIKSSVMYCPAKEGVSVTSSNFYQYTSLIAVPKNKMSTVNNLENYFRDCYQLRCVVYRSEVISSVMTYTFDNCFNLRIPNIINISETEIIPRAMNYAFRYAGILNNNNKTAPPLLKLRIESANQMFAYTNWSPSEESELLLDLYNTSSVSDMFGEISTKEILCKVPNIVSTFGAVPFVSIFENSKELEVIKHIKVDAEYMTKVDYMFMNCFRLHTIGTTEDDVIKFNEAATVTSVFNDCWSLENIKFIPTKTISFVHCPKLTRESILFMFNNAPNVGGQTITFHMQAYDRLTDEDLAIMTNKGWSVTKASR